MSRVIFQADLTEARRTSRLSRARLVAFLRLHGLDPNRVLIGQLLIVREDDDGNRDVEVWEMEDPRDACPHCPECVKQNKVIVRLRTRLPKIKGAYYAKESPR